MYVVGRGLDRGDHRRLLVQALGLGLVDVVEASLRAVCLDGCEEGIIGIVSVVLVLRTYMAMPAPAATTTAATASL